MKAQYQKGYVFRHGNAWYLRYRIREQQDDGGFKPVQKCRRLVEYGGQYRSKRAVQALADELLAPYNRNAASSLCAMTLNQWMAGSYLPAVKSSERRESTYRDYFNKWQRYIKPVGDVPLCEFRTWNGEQMLKAVADAEDLSSTTLRHIRHLMSGAFKYAIEQGVLDRANPMRYVKIPRARGPKTTYAYSSEEVEQMISVLPESVGTIVVLAAYTGLRDSELRGLKWEDFTGTQLRVQRSVWRGKVQPPKTEKSASPVPVISRVATRLNQYRLSLGAPASGFMFVTPRGTPIDLQALAQKVIRPTLAAANLDWHGCHACRRGLATNLHRLGVQDLIIQRILRHPNVRVTQACYIKTADADAVKAMETLERATVVQQAPLKLVSVH